MILGGDWAPGEQCVEFDVHVSGSLLANLEAPFLHTAHKYRPCLKAGPHIWTNSLPEIDGDMIFTLANNHMMDYGVEGLQSTLSQLNSNHIFTVGAGENASEAHKPLIYHEKDICYGILGCCEAQFGIAHNSQAGVAEFNASIYREIQILKQQVDIVIVSIHAASEMCPWPSPRCQSTYRSLVDAGAHIIHGHHAHIPQGYEYYQHGIIFYGLGNLCVNPAGWSQYPNALWSVTADLHANKDHISAEIVPVTIKLGNDKLHVQVCDQPECQHALQYLEQCNKFLEDRELLEGLWQENSIRLFSNRYAEWLGVKKQQSPTISSSIFQSLLKRIGFFKANEQALQVQNLLLWYVLLNCPSHIDAITTALGVLGGELNDCRSDETRRLADEMMPWSK